MSEQLKKEMEKDIEKLWTRYGASKKQRDAMYFGYLYAYELARQEVKINHEKLDPIVFHRKLNQIFSEKGFTIKERHHYTQGAKLGLYLALTS